MTAWNNKIKGNVSSADQHSAHMCEGTDDWTTESILFLSHRTHGNIYVKVNQMCYNSHDYELIKHA